jgi:hypothetical protein
MNLQEDDDLIIKIGLGIKNNSIRQWSNEKKQDTWLRALIDCEINPQKEYSHERITQLPRIIREVYIHKAQRVLIDSRAFAETVGVPFEKIDTCWDDVRAAAATIYFAEKSQQPYVQSRVH